MIRATESEAFIMKKHKDDRFEYLYTALKMIEEESNIKDELIDTLKEQNELLEKRIDELFSMIKKASDPEQKG